MKNNEYEGSKTELAHACLLVFAIVATISIVIRHSPNREVLEKEKVCFSTQESK